MMRRFTLYAILTLLFSGTIAYSQNRPPDFTVTDIDGNTYSLYEELGKGKVIVLDFFQRYCHICMEIAPRVEQIWQDYDGNVWVWKINIMNSQSATQVKSFKEKYGGTYPGFAGQASVFSYYLSTFSEVYNATPSFAIIGPDTTVHYAATGFNETSMRAILDSYDFSGTSDVENVAAAVTSLSVSPNPATTSTTLSFALIQASDVSASLYNTLGQKVSDIFRGDVEAGETTITIPTGGLTAGTYYVMLRTEEGFVQVLPLTVVR